MYALAGRARSRRVCSGWLRVSGLRGGYIVVGLFGELCADGLLRECV